MSFQPRRVARSKTAVTRGRNPGNHSHFRGGEERCKEEQREISVRREENFNRGPGVSAGDKKKKDSFSNSLKDAH